MDKKPDVVPYIWFEWEVALALAERIVAGEPGSRLVVRPSSAEINEHTKVTLEIEPPAGSSAARLAPLNKSFICPPWCP